MKTLNFDSESDFLNALDGKVYCIADEHCERFVCDLLEEDYTYFLDKGYILDKMSMDYIETDGEVLGNYSDTYLSDMCCYQDVFDRRVVINYPKPGEDNSLYKLRLVWQAYVRLIEAWVNREKAAEAAVKEVFDYMGPHIYSDDCNDPHYISHGDYVLIFDSGIYKKVEA